METNELYQDRRRIRARLRSYERKLRKEKEQYGFYRDGAGKRYRIGPYYLLLGDNEGALRAFRCFEKEFPDDAGEPGHYLSWSLALYRSKNEVGGAKKLRQTMLSNPYILPHLLELPIVELGIWHGSSDAEPSYLQWVPEEYFLLWTETERKWAARLYQSPGFKSVRERYIEIRRALKTTRPGTQRTRLVEQLHELEMRNPRSPRS